jgi:hypothetical protein
MIDAAKASHGPDVGNDDQWLGSEQMLLRRLSQLMHADSDCSAGENEVSQLADRYLEGDELVTPREVAQEAQKMLGSEGGEAPKAELMYLFGAVELCLSEMR